MRRVVRFALVALTVTLSLAGCDGDDDASQPTVTVSTPTTTTTTTAVPADAYAIPATIDAAYVQRVIDKLYEIEAEAVREIVDDGKVVASAAARLRAVFHEREFDLHLQEWGMLSADGFPQVRTPPGSIGITVESLARAQATCVVALTTLDSSMRFSPAENSIRLYTVLAPKAAERDPQVHNPTPWMIRIQAAGGPNGEPLDFDPCTELPSS